MKQYIITITAKEPLVLRTQSGSETRSDVVDYISGAKLLGLLAKECYTTLKGKDQDTLYQLFHSGNVRYGNAYPVNENTLGMPVPFSLYKEKNDAEETILTFSPVTHKKKQQKAGYITTSDGNVSLFTLPMGERLKSARDPDLEKRRSKDESMYLYSYLERGIVFQSTITVKEPKGSIREAILKLQGQHYIGTSKGEFGRIEIKISEPTVNPILVLEKDFQLKVYAVSDLIFLNKVGSYTTTLTPEMFGIENAELDLKASHIRFKQFNTYNSKRRTPDADRLAIAKGSILVFKSTDEGQEIEMTARTIKDGVGVHKTEGFGQILVNPSFLDSETIVENDYKVVDLSSTVVTEFGKLLAKKHENVVKDHDTYDETLDFIEKHKTVFKNTSQSQWGTIRHYILQAIASETPKATLIKLLDSKTGYLRQKANANWNVKQVALIEDLLEQENCIELLLKITVELPKTLQT